ncbi:phage antirepressor KilAC domain-containing protein [Halomonas caseinilytica]|uniref:Phage antirepressor protein KilAC domain-containing protein n=1 Tax=Halomonas caseinilytica TaxID=438744 RepID=A0A1M6RY50_9GAMM|nr:phage antirepressor KilAC domain-containing protein [Halomonas caseinilytica]SHK37381.1 Phage antirepressor protein KilAC domain-containing protein [Halomonas caseinilytica]
MTRYTLKQAAALLGTGRTTLCRELREMGMLDSHNLGTRQHTSAGRLIVELRTFKHVGLGQPKPYGKTFVTDRGLLYIANRLGRDVVTEREAANDAQA